MLSKDYDARGFFVERECMICPAKISNPDFDWSQDEYLKDEYWDKDQALRFTSEKTTRTQ